MMGPNDLAKVNRAIQLNVIGGGLMLAIVGLSSLLIAPGLVSWGPRAAIWLAIGVVNASLTFWTARSIRQDRDDPAGIERRFQAAANTLGAGVIVIGMLAVSGLIIWGLWPDLGP